MCQEGVAILYPTSQTTTRQTPCTASGTRTLSRWTNQRYTIHGGRLGAGVI